MAADASDGGVFFPKDSGGNASGFNKLVWFYPAWSEENKVQVNVIVDEDDVEGTREVRGDGVAINTREGRSVRRTIKIECPATLPVRQVQPKSLPDVFKVDGELFPVKRIVGQDDYTQTVLCIHRDNSEIRTENRVG